MKEFFQQCLKDLESLTGLRQLYFLETDEDGARKLEVLVSGMLVKSQEFSYIPDEDQQKIIRKMMVEDQDYDALNARTLHKWLSSKKDIYWQRHEDKREKREEPPAPPEVADMYANQLKEELKKIEIKTQRQPVEERYGKGVSGEYVSKKKKFVIDNVEILADDEDQAREIFIKNHL